MGMSGSVSASDKSFTELFQYELQNRALAIVVMNRTARARAKSADAEFWSAYARLEEVNQCRYRPIAQKYNLSLEPTFWTSVKAVLTIPGGKLLPGQAAKIQTQMAIDYLPQLEELAAVAPDADEAFFEYVNAQEKVQATSLTLLINGDIGGATQELQAFVQEVAEPGVSGSDC